MKLLFLVLAVVVLAAIAVLLRSRRPNVGVLGRPWPLERKPSLLTAPEQTLYRRLVAALPSHVVLAQVQLLQTVRFKRGSRDPSILNRISQLSIDFLVVTPDTRTAAAIELQDATHDGERRRAADARKAHALKSAGIPLLTWSVREIPDVQDIGVALAAAASAAN
jgi:hypothetical protein